MKGTREKYNNLNEYDTLLDFYIENTSLEEYECHNTAYSYLKTFCEAEGIEVEQITDEDAIRFCKHLKSQCSPEPLEMGQKTAKGYVQVLSRIFRWIVNNTNHLDWEPFSDAMDEVSFDFDARGKKKLELSHDELSELIYDIQSPTLLLLVVLLLKTGLRIGEATNLRQRDINLDHPVSRFMPSTRRELAGLPDTLYVDSSYSGNKPHSYREIPIDSELKQTMVWYIMLQPPKTEQSPHLLVDMYSRSTRYTGLSLSQVRNRFMDWAKRNDVWIEPYHHKNLHPHWCRHWFTTVLRANIDSDDVVLGDAEDYIGGLRGDSDDSIIDTYTQNWEVVRTDEDLSYREIYTDAMPHLLTGTDIYDEHCWDRAKEIV